MIYKPYTVYYLLDLKLYCSTYTVNNYMLRAFDLYFKNGKMYKNFETKFTENFILYSLPNKL